MRIFYYFFLFHLFFLLHIVFFTSFFLFHIVSRHIVLMQHCFLSLFSFTGSLIISITRLSLSISNFCVRPLFIYATFFCFLSFSGSSILHLHNFPPFFQFLGFFYSSFTQLSAAFPVSRVLLFFIYTTFRRFSSFSGFSTLHLHDFPPLF